MARGFTRASSQYVTTTSPPVTAAPFTVGGWVRRGNSATTQNIFGLGLSSALKFFGISWNGADFKPRAQHFDGTNNGVATGTTVVNVGDVVHLCGVFASTTSRSIFVNGVSEATDTANCGNAFTPDRWDFGTLDAGSGSKTDHFEGDLWEWAAWNVALDAAEIAALGKGVSPLLIRPQSLIGYWPFLDAAAPDVDRWKNRVDLTPVNAPTMTTHGRMFYPVGPQSAPAAAFFRLDAATGSLAITGSAATFKRAIRMVGAVGSYALSGVTAVTKAARKLFTDSGTYLSRILASRPVGLWRLNEQGYNRQVMAFTPSSYWLMGEASGNLADSAGSITGTANGSPNYGVAGPISDGGTAIEFDGSTDYFTFGDVYDFNGTTAFSVGAWVHKDALSVTTSERLFSKEITDGSGAQGWLLAIVVTTGLVTFQRRLNGAIASADSVAAIPINQWNLLIGTYDGTNLRLYVNGVLNATTASSASLVNHANPLTIGDSSVGFAKFTGKMARPFVLSGRALSQSEITALYGARTQTDATTSAQAADSSGNAHHGTYTDGMLLGTTGALADGTKAVTGTTGLSYVEVLYTADLAPTSQITMEAWAHRTDWSTFTSDQRVLSKTEGGGYQLSFNEASFYPGGKVGALVRRNGAYGAVSFSITNLSSGWHKFAATYDGQIITLYIDGVAVATNDAGGPFAIQYAVTNSLIIGAEAGTTTGDQGNNFNGSLDEVALYARALTAAEIADHYAARLNTGTTYGVTGSVVTFLKGRIMAAASGVYAITGSATTFKRALRLSAAIGAYVLSGLTAILRHTKPSTVNVEINGTTVTENIRFSSLEVEDVLNDAPNRCTFTCADLVPVEGQAIRVIRDINTIEFAGHIIRVEQFYEGILANVAYHVTCQDYTWKLNRRLVTKRWINQTATTIAQEIISGFTTGFTSTNVAAGLATIPEFRCDQEMPSRALTRLCAEIGGNHYIDYTLDLHLFITEAVDTPEDISDATLATTTARGLAHTGDLSQVRTRVAGTGIGSSALENISASGSMIPIDKSDMFEQGGGSLKSTENVATYTGRHLGGVAATVLGNVAGPTGSAPSVAVASGVVGVLEGNFQYKVAFANDQGETTPGSASAVVTGVAFAAPGAASIAAGSTIGRLIGDYLYKITNVTALGETIGGTQFSRTAVATTTPGAPSVAVFDSGVVNNDMGKLIGAYGYKVTTVNAYGESAASSAGTRTAAAQAAPAAPSTFSSLTDANSVLVAGPLKGTYNWKVAFVGPDGHETLGSSASSTFSGITPSTPTMNATNGPFTTRAKIAFFHPVYGESDWSSTVVDTSSTVPITLELANLGGNDNIPGGCQWRAASTDNTNHTTAGPFFDVGTAEAGASTLTYSSLGSVVTAAGNTLGRVARFTIPVGPTGTIARRIYRTREGDTEYFLVGQVGDNTTTIYEDNTPDASLTVPAPIQNLNGEQHALTSIATGATGTLKRRIYRTKAGGSTYYLLDEILDNSTTTYTDNIPDSQLNLAFTAPATATSGDQHALTSIPLGPTGTLARRIYRTLAGGTSFQFLYELTDNVATTYTDNTEDAALGQFIPLVNTAGANQIALTSIPTGGSSVTKRVIYRTEAGGSVYKYVATINDNATTTYTDNIPDSGLGREALTQSTIGAVAGDTVLLLSTVTGWPTAGWLKAGSQIIKWTGISGTQLTGIPGARSVTSITRSGTTATATTSGNHGFTTNDVVTIQGAVQSEYNGARTITVTGLTTFTYELAGAPTTPATGTITVYAAGAILASIPGGLGVVTAPFLSGVSGLTYTVEKGADVRIYVVRNDTAAQTALAALEGGDGIHEAPLDDASIETVTQLTAACDAELAAYSSKLRTITFKSRDPLLRSGKTITLDLGSPTNLSGDFLIQRVISTEFDTADGLNPMRDVIAAPVLVSFKDVLRRARADERAV